MCKKLLTLDFRQSKIDLIDGIVENDYARFGSGEQLYDDKDLNKLEAVWQYSLREVMSMSKNRPKHIGIIPDGKPYSSDN